MKNTVKLAMIGALLAAGTAKLAAQNNIAQNLNIALTGNVQNESGVQTMRVGSKEVVTAIGNDLGAVPAKSKIVLLVPAEGEGFSAVLRSPGADDVDVTSFFSQTTIGTSVTTSKNNFSIQEFVFHSSTLNFDVQGYTTSRTVNVRGGGTAETLNASVAGTGDVNGNSAVFKGTVSTSGPKLE